MNYQRWRDVLNQIKDNFSIEEEDSYFLDEHGGTKIESIVFEGSMGLVKLEFISKPRVIGTKALYSNRIGAEVDVEYEYSPEEKIEQFFAYRWSDNEDDWLPLDANLFLH